MNLDLTGDNAERPMTDTDRHEWKRRVRSHLRRRAPRRHTIRRLLRSAQRLDSQRPNGTIGQVYAAKAARLQQQHQQEELAGSSQEAVAGPSQEAEHN